MHLLRKTWTHLRVPFSWYLLPVFLIAVCHELHFHREVAVTKTLLLGTILHLFLYPASHAFNSYYDRDSGSIGGLKAPPPVSSALLFASMALATFGLSASVLLGWATFWLLLAYCLLSAAYSHPRIRFKRRPYLGTFVVALAQGPLVYSTVSFSSQQAPSAWGCLFSFLLIATSYPLTQIYQHEEDRRRGDITLSLVLGQQGTFVFSLIGFLLVGLCLLWGYKAYSLQLWTHLLAAGLTPSFLFFIYWACTEWKQAPTFENAMRMNQIASTGINLACVVRIWLG